MIRFAIDADIPRIVEMGLRFLRETSYREKLAENAQRIEALAKQLVPVQQVLVGEQNGHLTGMLAFIVFEHPMSGEKTVGEVVWWVDPEARGDGVKMLRELERIAKAAGATKLQMIAPNDRVASLYERLQYERVEVTYQRTIQ